MMVLCLLTISLLLLQPLVHFAVIAAAAGGVDVGDVHVSLRLLLLLPFLVYRWPAS
jgi:hypothetical protein